MNGSALTGRRILVTRTQEGSAKLSKRLRELGADTIEIPLIRILPLDSYAALDRALAQLAAYDLLLVTSANTARVLAERKPVPWDDQPITVVIGPATAAAMRALGLRVDLQPSPSIAESLVRELAPKANGQCMLLPRAETARELLPDALRAAGASVDVVTAYRTVPEKESLERLRALFAPGARPVDAITFTSGSTVTSFLDLLGEEAAAAMARTRAFSIGPITSKALRARGYAEYREAATHDLDGLSACLCKWLQT
jgi:uroporphyrinogen-III synthase